MSTYSLKIQRFFLMVSEDEVVAATINLGNLDQNDVHTILEALKPYESNLKIVTKKDLSASAGLGPLGLGLKDPTGVSVTF